MNYRARRGFVLITVGLCSVAMLGMLGVAVDLGRLYVMKNEMQAFADSAALAAALQLDGTTAGITRALEVVASNPNRWNFASTTFSGTQTDFATSASGPWHASPNSASNYAFVRVRASGSAPLYFLPVAGVVSSTTIAASAVAAQVPRVSFGEGLFPFSPLSHNNSPPHYGLQPGAHHTLRWGAGNKPCAADDVPELIARAKADGGDERGFIEETSSSIIRQAIENDYQTRWRNIGETVVMTGGTKQTQRTSLINRINQDTNTTATSYADYVASGTGNGRRLVVAPINSGHPNNTLLGYGLFFLLPTSEYPGGGGKPFCAEYVGSWVQGSQYKGAMAGGAYVVKLVQ